MTHFPREDSTSKVVDCQFFFRTNKIRPLRLKKQFFFTTPRWSRSPEMNSNQSEAVRVHFRGPWHIWGPLGGLRSQTEAISWADFPAPPPLPTHFYGPKWVVQVSHTQYYIFYVQLAPVGGIFGPLKSVFGRFGSIKQIYPLFLILEGAANLQRLGKMIKVIKIDFRPGNFHFIYFWLSFLKRKKKGFFSKRCCQKKLILA